MLPARVRGYPPRLLDELCAAGEVVWIGAGLARPATTAGGAVPAATGCRLLPPPAADEPPTDAGSHVALREHLAASRRLVLPRPAAAVLRAQPAGERAPSRRELLDALWDLVWSGEVTNDTFCLTPRAALAALRPPTPQSASAPRFRAAAGSARPKPPAAGRWCGRHLDRSRPARRQGSL